MPDIKLYFPSSQRNVQQLSFLQFKAVSQEYWNSFSIMNNELLWAYYTHIWNIREYSFKGFPGDNKLSFP